MRCYFGDLGIFIYVLFAGALFVVEEILIAREIYLDVQKVKKIEKIWTDANASGNLKKFKELTEDQKNILDVYYSSVYKRSDERMMIMAREASVQLTYQNALLVYQFINPPLLELDLTNDNSSISPSARWIGGLVLQIISIVLSAKSTFSPINDHTTLSGFKNGKLPGLLYYILQMVQVILHLMFATGIVYLSKVTKYILYYFSIYLVYYEISPAYPTFILILELKIIFTIILRIHKVRMLVYS